MGGEIPGRGDQHVAGRGASLRSPQFLVLANARLQHLEAVELGVLPQQRDRQRAEQSFHRVPVGQVAIDQPGGRFHLLLRIQFGQKGVEDFVGLPGQIACSPIIRQPRGWHVEEAVQVHCHGAVEHAADQFGRTRPFQSLMQGVGVGEGVQHRDPVAELVLGMETGDAQRGGVGDRLTELQRRHAFAKARQHGVHRGLGIVPEDHFGQRFGTLPGMTVRRLCQGAGQRVVRPPKDGRQVDGVAPGVGLLPPLRRA